MLTQIEILNKRVDEIQSEIKLKEAELAATKQVLEAKKIDYINATSELCGKIADSCIVKVE